MDANRLEEQTIGETIRGQSKYRKGGTAGIEGVLFQVDLLTVTLLNAFQNFKGWKLSTENKRYGKFDDVVLELPDGAILLQAKHRKNRKLLFRELFSINSKNNDFSLGKYFFSYQEIKAQVPVKYVVICTNSDVKVEDDTYKIFFNIKKDTSDSILYRFDNHCSFYTFNESVLPKLEEHARSYYDKNLQGKNVDEGVITPENLSEFLNHLKFYSSYPSEGDLNSDIEQLFSRVECARDLSCETSSKYIHSKMLDWFRQPQGIHLEDCHVKAMIAEMRSNRYCKELEEHNVSFDDTDLVFGHTKNILHVICKDWYLLNVLKVYCALQSNNKTRIDVLYVSPKDSVYIQQAVEAFQLPQYSHLIIIQPGIEREDEIRRINLKLREILHTKPYKKIILVSDSYNRLASEISVNNNIYETMEGYISFTTLSRDMQFRLLKVKNINFQGKNICLEELFSIQTLENNCDRVLHPETLEKLIKSEKIELGSPIESLDEHTKRCYVHRKFIRKIGSSDYDKDKKELIDEEKICDLEDKLILISDSPGAGKSTVFTHLAVIIKETVPHLWILRINLNDYSKVLKEFQKSEVREGNLLESLNMAKLRSQFERSVFSMGQRVLLMLDGVDEICPDYMELVLCLIFQCQKAPNFYKILITARPHTAKELEEKLNVKALTLQSFTKKDQIHFLTNYWMHSFKADKEKKTRCEHYATALVNKMPFWMGNKAEDKNGFTAVPLQLRMLAEIFEMKNQMQNLVISIGCKEYLEADQVEPAFPEEMNIAQLYKLFIMKKQDIFNHKGNPTGTTVADHVLNKEFQDGLDYHRSIALRVLLGDIYCRYISSYHYVKRSDINAKNLLKIGFLHQLDNGTYFMHGTFAEYFIAESFLMELKKQQANSNRTFQFLFVSDILYLRKFNVVRTFLDSLLQNETNSLPYDIFRNNRFFNYRINLTIEPFCRRDLIHRLAEGGYVEILRYLFKCIGFRAIASNNINILNCKDIKFSFMERIPFSVETLNCLKYLTDRGGVNILNLNNMTPLHYAAKNTHLKMVKFLLEHGANVNIRNSFGRTALWECKNADIAEILIRKGADINTEDVFGQSILYSTAVVGLWPIFKLLVENGAHVTTAGIDNSEYTVLHIVVRHSHLENAKLLVENGANVNVRNSDGVTPLHLAVLNNQLEIVKFLIQSGADVNGADKKGCTALHLASIHDYHEIVKFLVEECDVDVNVRDCHGYTALNFATARNSQYVEKLLLEAEGADTYLGNCDREEILGHIHHILEIVNRNRNKYYYKFYD